MTAMLKPRGRPRKSPFEEVDLLVLQHADMIFRNRYCAGEPMDAIREAVDLALQTWGVYLGGDRKQIVRRVRDRLKPVNVKVFDGEKQRTVMVVENTLTKG
jgi:hypothetical protein